MYKFSRQYHKLNSIFETTKTEVFSQADVNQHFKSYKAIQKYMKTKLKIILLISFFTVILQGQELKPKQIHKIESFGIDYNRLINENINYKNDFLEILKKEHKRKKNKTIGYVFSSLGLLTTTGGILILSNIKDNPDNDMNEAGAYQAVMGGFITAIGVIEIGVSIPLFISSKKRNKEKNQLILEVNPNFKE